jgi:hypothetical protein
MLLALALALALVALVLVLVPFLFSGEIFVFASPSLFLPPHTSAMSAPSFAQHRSRTHSLKRAQSVARALIR